MHGDRPDGIAAELNVTPMIDVLLVLVIIAMILMQLRAILPLNVPPLHDLPGHARPGTIVLELDSVGGYRINGSRISEARLEPRLLALYAKRGEKLLFIRAAGARPYHEVTHAIDAARSAGILVIGYMP
jgi:biopolymer transport protein ExbD